MDKQLEQRIRERAYELWTQDGCQPDRSDEYWLRAEREITGEIRPQETAEARSDFAEEIGQRSAEAGSGTGGSLPSDEGAHRVGALEEPDAGTASLFATSTTGTSDEEAPGMAARKGRRKRAAAAETAPATETAPDVSGSAGAPAKRKRSVRSS